MKISIRIVLVLLMTLAPLRVWAADKVLNIQEVVSPMGVKAWLVEDHSIPVIAMDFSFLGAGAVGDAPEKQGLAQLASNTMDEGAGDIDSLAFQKKLTDLAITLRFSSGRDDFSGTLKTLSMHKDDAFSLLQKALTSPRFDPEPVERMRKANQSRIRRSMSDPNWMAARIMNDKAYAGHPYAQNSGGTVRSLDAITSDDLKDFAATRLARDNLVVSVAGDISAQELSSLLDKIFGGLREKAELKKVAPLALQNTGKTFLYEQDIPQSVVSLMQRGISHDDPRYQVAQVLNQILGASGFGSRLMKNVREDRGLTYGIYSSLYHLEGIDTLSINSSTKNETAGELLEVTDQTLRSMISAPVSEKELQDAKAYLIGSLPLALTSTSQIASLLDTIQCADLGIDYLDKRQAGIGATTIKDVQDLAREMLDPDNMVRVLVGKPEGVENTVRVEALENVE